MTTRTFTGQDRRIAVAALAGAITTGATCDTTPAALHNLAAGLLLGVPVALAMWALLTVAHQVIGGAR